MVMTSVLGMMLVVNLVSLFHGHHWESMHVNTDSAHWSDCFMDMPTSIGASSNTSELMYSAWDLKISKAVNATLQVQMLLHWVFSMQAGTIVIKRSQTI